MIERLDDNLILIHDSINYGVKAVVNKFKKKDASFSKKEARRNLWKLIYCTNFLNREYYTRHFTVPEKITHLQRDKEIKLNIDDKKTTSLERLVQKGEAFVTYKEIKKIDEDTLFDLARFFDRKGIILNPEESIQDYIYRANSIMLQHKMLKKHKIGLNIKFDEKTYDLDIFPDPLNNLISQKEIDDANEKIPYHMDLSWIAAFSKDHKILQAAYGVCFTSPKYNGFNFVMMREHYKNRDKFLDVLAHEMAHMGTVYLDTERDFLETKAYLAGTAAFGEHTIALNTQPNIFFRIAKYVTNYFNYYGISDHAWKYIPKVLSAIKIQENKSIFNGARKALNEYAPGKGDYILGRLTAEEINEFGFTNNVEARINMKNDLKWRIMNHNITKI